MVCATEWFLNQSIALSISAPSNTSDVCRLTTVAGDVFFNVRSRTTQKPLTIQGTRGGGGTHNEPADGYNTVFSHVSIGGSIDRSIAKSTEESPRLPIKEVLVGPTSPAEHLLERSGLGNGGLNEISELHPRVVGPYHHSFLSQ